MESIFQWHKLLFLGPEEDDQVLFNDELPYTGWISFDYFYIFNCTFVPIICILPQLALWLRNDQVLGFEFISVWLSATFPFVYVKSSETKLCAVLSLGCSSLSVSTWGRLHDGI